MATEKEYFAFISYQREDEEWAKWLAHELEHYHFPVTLNGRKDLPKDLRPIFRDIDELSAGNLPNQIHKALANSKHLIVICSPRSAQSKWVNKEIEEFINMDKTDKIFPFIIDGKAYAEKETDECFPPALRNLPREEERLGGNINEMGRDAAVVKIVAGMLDLDFDALWQRYEKEKAEEERNIKEQRDNLLKVQSRFLSEKANALVDDGDSYTARLLALEALPKDIENQDRPFVVEAEIALRNAVKTENAVFHSNLRLKQLSFNPNGDVLIAKSYDGFVYYWDMRTGDVIESFKSGCLYHPENQSILICNWISNSVVSIIDAFTKKEKNVFDDAQYGFADIVYSPNGQYVAVCPMIGPPKIFNATIKRHDLFSTLIPDGKSIRLYVNYSHTDFLTFSSDSQYIISVHKGNHAIQIWAVENGKLIRTIEDSDYAIFSPKGGEIAIAFNKKVKIVDFHTGNVIRELTGHTEEINTISYSQDGNNIISSSDDGTSIIWDANSGSIIRTLYGDSCPVTSAIFSPDDKFAAFTSINGNIRIIDLKPAEREKTIHEDANNKNGIYGRIEYIRLSFSPDSTKLAIADNYGDVEIRSCSTGKLLFQFKAHTLRTIGHINNIFYSNNGKMLLTNSDEEVCVWDSVDGHLLYHFYKSDLLSTSAVSFSPNDNNVIICYDNKVKNWNLENDTINNLRDPNLSFAHKDTVRSAFYSFDNSKIITAADDYKLKIWDAKSFKLLQTIEGVSNVIFSPDGKKYIRKYMYYIELYDFNSGKLICGFSNLSSSISYVSFLVNGDYIVTEADNTIRVWDTITGKMVDYYEHDDYITGITCNPKENRIAFTLKGKTIKTISFPYLKTLYDENKMRFGSRQFTREEREKYYLD